MASKFFGNQRACRIYTAGCVNKMEVSVTGPRAVKAAQSYRVGITTADIWADHNKHSMAWFIEKTMRFRFKFSDFDLYINILTIFKFQKGRLSFTMTQATLPGLIVIYPTVAFVQESSATLSILTISGATAVLFASIFVELNNNP